jgi:two-component system KDP operon response regulator KdpE
MMQSPEYGPIFRMGRTIVDLADKTVTRDGDLVHLAPIEFHLLAELIKQAGRVVTQRHLMLRVWQHTSRSNLPVLRAYIAILRKKLSHYPSGDVVIETIPGVGYRLYHTWSDK